MAASRRRKRIHLALVAFWSVVLAWLLLNMQARGVSPSAFEDGGGVDVTFSDTTLAFMPRTDTAAAGLIFYPGALVDPRAYAPMARAVAEAGYPVVVAELPFRLAPLDRHRRALVQRTRALMRSGPDRRRWVVGGHSRGGALAAAFARDYPSALDGLLLVGTSHPREDDLSGLAVDVTKVYGSEDGLASEEEVERFAPNLPAATHRVRVAGGNHRQFGWYGWQLGDGEATISRTAQQEATVRAILDQLRRVAVSVEEGS